MDTTTLTLRLRAYDLAHDHSVMGLLAPSTVLDPDTYFELSRRSYGNSSTEEVGARDDGGDGDVEGETNAPGTNEDLKWIVVHRSPLVQQCASPMWDEVKLNLDALSALEDNADGGDKQHASTGFGLDCPLMVSVHKMKKRKCKEIGSFETTVRLLLDAAAGEAPSKSLSCGGEADGPEMSMDSGSTKAAAGSTKAAAGGEAPMGSFVLSRATNAEESAGRVAVVRASLISPHQLEGVDVGIGKRGLSGDRTEGNHAETREDEIGSIRGGEDAFTAALVPASVPAQTRQAPFSDYVAAGLEMDFCVSIDFTSSNGDPRIPGTLHYNRDGMMNDYEEAIEAIGSKVAQYSSSKQFPVWGFGAKYDGEVQHIFRCGEEDAAKDVAGILDAYRSIFKDDLTMSGPTVMTSVIQAAAVRSRKFHRNASRKNMRYGVLLILTDGIVSDFESTKAILSSCHELPLSVVMVGIGRGDFSEMNEWNSLPVEQGGRVSFVKFRDHQFDANSLSRAALRRIPRDVVDYFSRNDIAP